jgi:hypothetical protein
MAPRTKKASCKRKAKKYSRVKPTNFCGAEGGACPKSFPVNTKKRARAALAYAHVAPNPDGIRKCVRRKYPSLK